MINQNYLNQEKKVMDILDSFGDYIQFIVTIIGVVLGVRTTIDFNDSSESLISYFGIPLVAVWIFFDYDIYLGMITGSLICIFSKKFDSDMKFVAGILLIMTLIKFGYFGFLK